MEAERKTDAVGRSVLKEGPAAATPCQGQSGLAVLRGGGAEFNGRMFASRFVPQSNFCRLEGRSENGCSTCKFLADMLQNILHDERVAPPLSILPFVSSTAEYNPSSRFTTAAAARISLSSRSSSVRAALARCQSAMRPRRIRAPW